MAKGIYKGFSTLNWQSNKNFATYDIEVIKRDLFNHIFTEYGERVNMPGFGTRIPSLVFEPNDYETREIIREDLLKVFKYDPRIQLIELNLYSLPDNNAIVATAKVKYLELNIVDNIHIEVQSKNKL